MLWENFYRGSMESENDYVYALGTGDTKAFEILFLRYQPKLVRFFAGFIHDDKQAEDLAQDVFLNLWKNREKLQLVKSFQSYLYQMARNMLYNYYDHSLVHAKYDIEQIWKPIKCGNLEEEMFARDLQAIINCWIDHLPPKRQQVFKLSRIEGLSSDEIAKQLHINKRTVENHLSVALSELRKLLQCFICLCSL